LRDRRVALSGSSYGGSFVTSKEFPGDLDLFMVMTADFDLEKANAKARPLFDYAQAKISFNSDVFWAKSSIGEETLEMWLETYQMTREFEPRGIVEVRIHDQD